MPHGVCRRYPGHSLGPGGGPNSGGPGDNRPHGGVAPLTLGGVAIPLSPEFKQLGVGQRLAAENGTGPVLRGRLDKGLAITRRVRCLPTFSMREVALANSVALYGLELADIEGRTLSAAHTAAAKLIWGLMRCSWAKERLWGLLARGFYVSPLWRVQYERLLWLARQARTPGTTQTSVQVALECRDPPPSTRAVGRALEAAHQPGRQRLEGWWHWDVPLALGAGGRRRLAPPRARELAPSGFPGVGAARANLWGPRQSRAPAGMPGRLAGGLHGGRPQHRPGAAGRGHVYVHGGQGGGARHPAVGQVPLLRQGARDGAAHSVGLPALGIGAPDMDAVGLQEARALPVLALPAVWPVCLRATGLLPLALARAGGDAKRGGCCTSCMACTLPCCRPTARRRRQRSWAATRSPRCLARHGVGARTRGRGTGCGSWRVARCALPQHGTPCSCRRARWRAGRGSAALQRPW